MVGFKEDAATETVYLVDVNGRFWGSLQLGIDADVDFPELRIAYLDGPSTGPIRDA